MPARIRPQLAANRRVTDHETDRVSDFLGANQSSELCVGQDMLLDITIGHVLQQGGINKTRVDNASTNAVEHGFFHQGRSGTLQASLGAGVGNLTTVTL